MAKISRRAVRRVAASSLLLLLTAAAQGAIYSGRFDPVGVPPDFPGFNGEAIFNVDNSCFDLSDGWHETNSSTSCGDAFMTSATVNLYEPEDTILDPANRADFFTLTGSYSLLGVYIVDGLLAGVDTDPLGPAFGSGDPDEHWTNSTPFWLQFESGCLGDSPMPGCFPSFLTYSSSSDPAYIYVGGTDLANRSGPAVVTFQAVPEPGTLSLLLGALGLGWLTRKRAVAR